jgi:hypothetical protein
MIIYISFVVGIGYGRAKLLLSRGQYSVEIMLDPLLVTRHPSLVTLITSPDYVWIVETLIPAHVSTVSWYFHPARCGLFDNNSLLCILLIKEIENPENRELKPKNEIL